jgi:Uma2 family endonuclease
MTTTRLTLRDLDLLPEPMDDTRYELIDGELYVTRQPNWQHQRTCDNVTAAFAEWDPQAATGLSVSAPGVVFAVEEAVAPDLVWVSRERQAQVLGNDGKLHAAPDLMVEVLSPGSANEARDRDVKLALYSRRGVREYWIVDWQHRGMDVYRRRDGELRHAATLYAEDLLESPLLPGFACHVARFFVGLPAGAAE